MYEIVEQVQSWRAAGRAVRVAQVVATVGFSSRDPAAALAWTDGEAPVGGLFDGVAPAAVVALEPGLHELVISDAEANAAGLSCGGRATVLVSDAAALPDELWSRVAAREPVCLVVTPGTTSVYTPQTIREAMPFADPVPRLFARGTSASDLLDVAGERAAVIALWPVPTLVVVGDGLIAAALRDAATLLDWRCQIVNDADSAVTAAAELHRSDAYVVLSHDRAVDGPALSAALASAAGYVGALGSRRTQAARREWLTGHDVPEADQGRIHGPAGLDIDAHTPAEIAVSIVAEILGNRAQTSGGALRDRSGPVHTGGVHAPPPRYDN